MMVKEMKNYSAFLIFVKQTLQKFGEFLKFAEILISAWE